jgi:hypothetical protein
MNIEFVSYDGKYPCLCSGKLTLKIDGRTTTFGAWDCDYPKFWVTGGNCGFNSDYSESYVNEAPWELSDYGLEKRFTPYYKQMLKLFNDNVPHGCCGGCL